MVFCLLKFALYNSASCSERTVPDFYIFIKLDDPLIRLIFLSFFKII